MPRSRPTAVTCLRSRLTMLPHHFGGSTAEAYKVLPRFCPPLLRMIQECHGCPVTRAADQPAPACRSAGRLAGIHRVRFCRRDFRGSEVWVEPGGVQAAIRSWCSGVRGAGAGTDGRWSRRGGRLPRTMGGLGGAAMVRAVRWGTARNVAGPAPAGTGWPRASGSASAGAIAALSGSAGRAGPDSGPAGSWW
jgi:hypothetical protein